MFGYCKSDPSIPIEQLDYKYIGSCKDIDRLQKIIKVLRSGDEGIYPDLTKFAEDQLQKYSPQNPLLEKTNPEKNFRDLDEDERQSIVKNLQGLITDSKSTEKGRTEEDDNVGVPPIRSTKNINIDEEKKSSKESEPNTNNPVKQSNKRVTPRNYDEWAKLDKEIEEKSATTEESVKESKTKINNKGKGVVKADEMVDSTVNVKINGASEGELAIQAENEKNKGNEAFRSGDFKEALVYYDRSLNLKPVAAVYNNRAMTYIRLEKYSNALEDCNIVLKEEPNNIKAYLRRGLAYQSLRKLELALSDFTKVVEIEPKNKRGKELYESVFKELEKQNEIPNKKGKRLIVEEVSSDDTNVASEQQPSRSTKKGNRLVIEEIDSSTADNNKTSVPEINDNASNNNTDTSQTSKNELENSSETSSDEQKSEIVAETPVQQVVVKELPEDSVKCKNEGNELYKNGQYQDAHQKYTFAIQTLMEDSSSFKAALSSLFNNRAICQLKSGNCSECIRDCTKSLKYLPNVKAVLRRAMAYEAVEKYKEAYVDYQIAFSRERDPKTSQAMARISNLLKSEYGKEWHDKLPKKQDLDWGDHPYRPQEMLTCPTKLAVEDSPSPSSESSAPSPKIDNKEATPKKVEIKHNEVPVTKVTKERTEKVETKIAEEEKHSRSSVDEPKTTTKEEQFVETKEKGNAFVKKGKFSEAIPFYTKCIELLPSEIPSYTNRALCYLKLKQPKAKEAIDDCTTALTMQKGNVKALFRRAQGYRISKKYKDALGDLTTILKEEPKNTAAQKEMDECKELYLAELRQIQSKSQPKGKSRKMKIEEITSETINRPSKKQTTKTDTCPMAKGNTTSTSTKPGKKNAKKMNGVEFMQIWNGIKSGKSADYADVLRDIEPSKLPELLSNKIDGKILENFIRAVHDHFSSKEHYKNGMLLLKHMYRVQRFSTNLMFLSTQDKTMLKSTIDILENRVKQDGGERLLQNEINQLRAQYRCPSS